MEGKIERLNEEHQKYKKKKKLINISLNLVAFALISLIFLRGQGVEFIDDFVGSFNFGRVYDFRNIFWLYFGVCFGVTLTLSVNTKRDKVIEGLLSKQQK